MDDAATQTLPEVLKQIFETLDIDEKQRETMTAEVVGLLALTAMDKLLQQKSEGERQKIQTEIEAASAGKSETEKAQVILEYFNKHWDKATIEKANETAAKELLPKYFKAVLAHATPEQQQKVQTLLDNLQAK